MAKPCSATASLISAARLECTARARVGDAGDPPVPELARSGRVGLDAVAEVDGHLAAASRPTMVAAWRCSRHSVVSGALVPPLSSQHLDHVGDQHMVVGAGVAGPGGGVAGVGVDEAGGRGRDGGHASASAALFGHVVQVGERGVALGVHDGVHVLGPAEHPELGHRLVGGDHQLHARPLGRDQSLAGRRVGGPAGAVEGVVGRVVDRADKAEGLGARAAPGERGLAPGGVVVECRAGEVVAAAR